jgi:hypothetical protein
VAAGRYAASTYAVNDPVNDPGNDPGNAALGTDDAGNEAGSIDVGSTAASAGKPFASDNYVGSTTGSAWAAGNAPLKLRPFKLMLIEIILGMLWQISTYYAKL